MKKNIFKTITHTFRKYLWVLALIGLFLGMRWFYSRDGVQTLAVKIVTPEKKVIEKTISASGKVKSQNSADLSFNTSGRVSYLGIKKGDTVKKGQLLARLDTSIVDKNIQYYKDARDIAVRNRELFVQQYDSHRNSVGGDDEYNIMLRKNDEMVSQAEAAYQGQLDAINNSYIYASFEGVVTDVKKELGENAAPGEVVVKVENLNNIIFEIALDQEDYGYMKIGQFAKVELDAYSNVEFTGKVTSLPLYADGISGTTFTIEISLDKKEESTPLVGMTGDAKVVVNKTEGEVSSLFYDQVLFDDNDKPYVFVLDGNLIKKQSIEIGLEGDIYTEIKTVPDKQIVVGLNDKIEVKEGYKANIMSK